MKIADKARFWAFFAFGMVVLSLIGVGWNVFTRGQAMNLGIDFTGGTYIDLRFNSQITTSQVRTTLAKFGLSESVIQLSGEKDVLIRAKPLDTETKNKIVEALGKDWGGVELLELNTIGPIIGKELRTQAILALLLTSLGIIVYMSFRFEFKFALAAVLALFHDTIIVTCIMAVLWREIEITFVAGIMTIMGYSINDTIIVFDRIRENLKKPGKKNFFEVANRSIMETLPRTINTVLTVIICVLCLLFFGGKTLRDFSLVLLLGFSIGTYSSIFVATPLVALWEKRK